VVLWSAMLLTTLFLLSFWAESIRNNPQTQSISSLSWSGYLIGSSFNQSQSEVNQVSGSWIVPNVNASTGNSYSSAWIGIGGQYDKTLIQIGTEHNYVNGNDVYNAWYELLPAFAIKVTNVQISAGDRITASISLVDSNADLWNIQIIDITNGQAFNQNFPYNSTRLSGEWMVERPSVNNQVSTLADFGTIAFTDCAINLNGVVGSIGDFSYSQIRMTNNAGIQLTSVSPVDNSTSGFSVTYLSNQSAGAFSFFISIH